MIYLSYLFKCRKNGMIYDINMIKKKDEINIILYFKEV